MLGLAAVVAVVGLMVVVGGCLLIVFNAVVAVSNHAGSARILKGEQGVRRFIDRCKFVRMNTPLLWSASKRNRRTEVAYYLH